MKKGMNKKELKNIIRQCIQETIGVPIKETTDEFEKGRLQAAYEVRNKMPERRNPVGSSKRWIQGYKYGWGRGRIKSYTQSPPEETGKDSQLDFGITKQ
jgi:hypothetical protein